MFFPLSAILPPFLLAFVSLRSLVTSSVCKKQSYIFMLTLYAIDIQLLKLLNKKNVHQRVQSKWWKNKTVIAFVEIQTLACVFQPSPAHYCTFAVVRLLNPPSAHHMADFITSFSFHFLDFPSETMFAAWASLFYALQTGRKILASFPTVSPPFPPFLHPACDDHPSGSSAGYPEQWGPFTSQYCCNLSLNHTFLKPDMDCNHVCFPVGPLSRVLYDHCLWHFGKLWQHNV